MCSSRHTDSRNQPCCGSTKARSITLRANTTGNGVASGEVASVADGVSADLVVGLGNGEGESGEVTVDWVIGVGSGERSEVTGVTVGFVRTAQPDKTKLALNHNTTADIRQARGRMPVL